MRKILIPTDFSENAMNAILFALELFKYERSIYYIMHAYQDDIYADETLLKTETIDKVTQMVEENSKVKLEAILKKINKISPNPKHTYSVIASNNLLLDEVNKIVDKQNIDVLVMGTKGKTNDSKLTFGSYTLQVLKYVRCPVLAIPENYKYTQPKYVLFPTNFMVPYNRRELKLLCEMVYPFRGVIDVLYISKSNKLSLRQEDNKAFINGELRKNKINFIVEKSNHIINSIYKYLIQNKIDMLVMVNTKHTFLGNIVFQSTIDELSLNLNIPFLALQNIKRS
jgi:nucleotide-binding universal stress UspA family protein